MESAGIGTLTNRVPSTSFSHRPVALVNFVDPNATATATYGFAYANHPMNNLDNYAEEMGWAEWTADGGGDDLEGMEAE